MRSNPFNPIYIGLSLQTWIQAGRNHLGHGVRDLLSAGTCHVMLLAYHHESCEVKSSKSCWILGMKLHDASSSPCCTGIKHACAQLEVRCHIMMNIFSECSLHSSEHSFLKAHAGSSRPRELCIPMTPFRLCSDFLALCSRLQEDFDAWKTVTDESWPNL